MINAPSPARCARCQRFRPRSRGTVLRATLRSRAVATPQRNNRPTQSACRPTSRPIRRVELPGRTLRFKATAGSIPINNGEGKLQAEIAYIAYVRPDVEAASRPLTFVFNGGPGAASAYMQLGALGPWRLPLDDIAPSSTAGARPQCRDLARLHRSGVRRSGRHRLQPLHQSPATTCASSSGRSMAISTCLRPSCANGSRRPAGRRRRNSSPARATAASARRSSPASSTSKASASAAW